VITPQLRAEMRMLVLRDGWKIESVARRFGVHHSVVRRALLDPTPPDAGGPGPSARSSPTSSSA
jgi:transposase-like protein